MLVQNSAPGRLETNLRQHVRPQHNAVGRARMGDKADTAKPEIVLSDLRGHSSASHRDDCLEEELKSLYAEALREPVPDKLLALLDPAVARRILH